MNLNDSALNSIVVSYTLIRIQFQAEATYILQ